VNVTATPAAGYVFDHWSGACAGSGTCQVTMDDDKSVTAHFTLITHDLTIAVDPAGGGTTNPAVGVHSYTEGAVVNVTATPAAGYVFDSWSGACTGGGACKITMNADKSVTAHFTITYELTVAVDPIGGGTTNPAVGVRTYKEGAIVPVTATPAAGYAFDHWSGDCTGSGTCQVTMDDDKSVTAYFTVITHDLTIAVDPVGGGTTHPTVGVHSYTDGAVVNVTATPADGYAFDSWSGACTGSGACQVTMDDDKSVTAHFTEITYDLTVVVEPTGGGTINPAVGVHTYAEGAGVNITATPADGYAFDSWSGACTGSGACQVIMDADKTVTAHFTEITYDLTVAVNPIGGGTTDPAVSVHTYPEGAVVPITATPANGYAFDSWSGACTGSGACQVTMDADKTVNAHFTEITPTCYVLVLSHTGQGNDLVASPDNSIGCPAGQYVEGETINLSGAVPEIGWRISGWTGTANNASTASTNTLTMPGNGHAVSVVYKAYLYIPMIFRSVTPSGSDLARQALR
jgi:uncharacterized repeat protein (TIGR02543 family)